MLYEVITGRRRTILAADDDPDHLALLREVLEPLGFRLICAPDGATCLAMAGHLSPDMFLLDVSMPEVDGWEVARRLRAGGFPAEPIVMVSANAMECRAGTRPGDAFDDFVVKPFEIGVLLGKIARYLGLEWTRITSYNVCYTKLLRIPAYRCFDIFCL